jgi:hypothetical protein
MMGMTSPPRPVPENMIPDANPRFRDHHSNLPSVMYPVGGISRRRTYKQLLGSTA